MEFIFTMLSILAPLNAKGGTCMTPSTPNNIVVVDDTPHNLTVLTRILSEQGYLVRPAINGQLALTAIRKQLPDIILLDIMMPGMDGYEVCRRLKADENTRDIPVMFVTAKGEVEDEAKGLELGAVDYITKPITPSIVQARVKNHLELKRAREELKKQNLKLFNLKNKNYNINYNNLIKKVLKRVRNIKMKS